MKGLAMCAAAVCAALLGCSAAQANDLNSETFKQAIGPYMRCQLDAVSTRLK